MENVVGDTLKSCWESLDDTRKKDIARKVRECYWHSAFFFAEIKPILSICETRESLICHFTNCDRNWRIKLIIATFND